MNFLKLAFALRAVFVNFEIMSHVLKIRLMLGGQDLQMFESSDIASIRSFVEQLYLGEALCYDMYLDMEDLNEVEAMFDELIREHGFRDVEFNYKLRQSVA